MFGISAIRVCLPPAPRAARCAEGGREPPPTVRPARLFAARRGGDRPRADFPGNRDSALLLSVFFPFAVRGLIGDGCAGEAPVERR
jgi:hypothetical protein